MKGRHLEKGDIIAVPRNNVIRFGVVSHFKASRLYYWTSLWSYEKDKPRFVVDHASYAESSGRALKIKLETIPFIKIRNELSEILVLLNI